jgi:maleamate amidohydrolase
MSGRTYESDVEVEVYRRQGFGGRLGIEPPLGLLIVDFVVGFADPRHFGGGNIATAIERTATVLLEARRRGWPIAHTRIVYAEGGADGNVFSTKVPTLLHLTASSPLSALVPQLAALPNELVVHKTVPSAFFETGLRSWLTQQGVRTLLVCGTTTSGCVRASVVDAMSSGFRPVVLRDCVGDRASAAHDASLFDIEQKYADVLSWDECLRELARSTALPRVTSG